MLGDLAGALARQAGIVAVDRLQAWRQRSAVGMPDQVQANVDTVLHALQDFAQLHYRRRRDLSHAGLEVNRRHQAGELDRFERVLECFASFDRVALFGGGIFGILDPDHEGIIAGKMAFDRLTHFGLVDFRGMARGYGQGGATQQYVAKLR